MSIKCWVSLSLAIKKKEKKTKRDISGCCLVKLSRSTTVICSVNIKKSATYPLWLFFLVKE